jgi:TolB-like protein
MCPRAGAVSEYGSNRDDDARETIAVLDFMANNVSEETARGVSDLLSTELWRTGYFRVIERQDVIKAAEQMGFSRDGVWICDEVSCAVDMGTSLEVEHVMIGSVSRFGGSVSLSVRIVDVDSREVAVAQAVEAPGGEEGIPRAVRELAALLAPAATRGSGSSSIPEGSYAGVGPPGGDVGSLSVSVDPDKAEIAIDGVFAGIGNVSLQDIVAGRHIVTVTYEGYRTEDRRVLIQADRETTLRIAMEKSTWNRFRQGAIAISIIVVLVYLFYNNKTAS